MNTTTNISGTWSKKQRPNCGLDLVAEHIHEHRLTRVPVVAYIEFHQYTEMVAGNTLTVAIPAIEPGMDEDGTDPEGLGQQLWEILDKLRRRRSKGAVADTLFSVPVGTSHRGDDEELEGQQELIRVGADGPHVVPPASGEELTAELDERRAASGPTRAEQEADKAKASVAAAAAAVVKADADKLKADLRRRVTGSAEPADKTADKPAVPAAAFSGDVS